MSEEYYDEEGGDEEGAWGNPIQISIYMINMCCAITCFLSVLLILHPLHSLRCLGDEGEDWENADMGQTENNASSELTQIQNAYFNVECTL